MVPANAPKLLLSIIHAKQQYQLIFIKTNGLFAHFLRHHFDDIQIHEATGITGGLARSFKWHGFDCDLAPHRLYTNNASLLAEILALVPCEKMRRRSRIYIQGRWIQDPVNAVEIILKFLPVQSLHVLWTYLFKQRLPEDHFEALVLSKFGSGLNKLFFKPYSEKLFGIPASEISAVWGHRKLRVGGLQDMLRRNSKLYFSHFYYPRQSGYGAICERLFHDLKPFVRLHSHLTGITYNSATGRYYCVFDQDGLVTSEEFDYVVSSLPIPLMGSLLGFDLPLRFRPARLVYLLIDKNRVSSSHWFYFADGHYIINRVAEFKNFASGTVPADKTVLCCEITSVDRYSPQRVIDELVSARLIEPAQVLDTKIIDIPHAYPIYDRSYEAQMRRIGEFFAEHPHLFNVGRYAQFIHKDVDEILDEAKNVADRIVRLDRQRGR
ncbi:FAD-dependent oxidoreductase [Gammaproteobacteria bacterium]